MRFFLLSLLLVLGFANDDKSYHFQQILKSHGLTEEGLADQLRKSAFASIVRPFEKVEVSREREDGKISLPIVFAHGMGDSCFNDGMKQITELAGKHMGVYSVCIPTGITQVTDTTNGFFMTMNKNVDVFAKKVRRNKQLANGFHLVGFSQGNSVARGYIQKYQDPPVSTWLSVHGTVNGVAGFPNCNPDGLLGPVCKLLASLLGDLAFEGWVQNLLFQADYFRDPMRYNDTKYLQNSEIAQWNNENPATKNTTFKDNFVKTKRFAMIKAMRDSMVYPNEGEWWGQFEANSRKKVLTMRQTPNYINDAYGLKTVDQQGKIIMNVTSGNHLQFTQEELYWWLDNYIVE